MTAPTLVAFDLDGTLAKSKQPVTSDMGALLARLMEHVPVAVFSGASWGQFEKQFLPTLPAEAALHNLYIFPTNAGACYAFGHGQWHTRYVETLTEEEKTRIHAALNAALDETKFPQPPHTWGEQIEDRGSQITFSALGQKAPLEEKRAWDPTRSKRRPLQEALMRRLPEFTIGLNATTSIDITHQGVTKAFGVRKLSEMLNLPVETMLYVGDALFEGGNDAIVIETGIQTQEVTGPEETTQVIERILADTAA